MTEAPPVSVIVVSRGRPEMLTRCLTGLGQLFYPGFEIVVVADPAGCAAVGEIGWQTRIKLIPFDAPNISAARNAGLGAAAGELIAFIDDDAVPEPTWLTHLTQPFASARVGAASGYVRGRNGISFQWRGRMVDRLGRKSALLVSGDAPFTPAFSADLAVKTEGTNCAFRRDILAGMGGFDPGFHFFLDETDLNLRLAAKGVATAIVPLAQVHHGYAASDNRAADRAPKDLHQIGASSAVFWRKHALRDADIAKAQAGVMAEQRTRLLRYMVDGRLEPRDINRLLSTLEEGFHEGETRPLAPLPPIPPAGTDFLPFRRPGASGRSIYLAGRVWNRRHLAAAARLRVARGDVVTVFRFSPTGLPHRVRFHPEGYWEQRGGLFGPANRDEPAFRLIGFANRVQQEWRRVVTLRH